MTKSQCSEGMPECCTIQSTKKSTGAMLLDTGGRANSTATGAGGSNNGGAHLQPPWLLNKCDPEDGLPVGALGKIGSESDEDPL